MTPETPNRTAIAQALFGEATDLFDQFSDPDQNRWCRWTWHDLPVQYVAHLIQKGFAHGFVIPAADRIYPYQQLGPADQIQFQADPDRAYRKVPGQATRIVDRGELRDIVADLGSFWAEQMLK